MPLPQPDTESSPPSLMPDNQERPSQLVHQMMGRVTEELKKATYRVDLTAEGAILHADRNIVEAVIDCLESRHNLTHETLKLPPGIANPRSKSSATNPRLPSDGFKDEDDSYEPLVHLLNKVVDAANQCISASHLSGLRLHHFGNEAKGRYDCAKGLKPDCIGIIGELPTRTEDAELSWENIEVIVESKRTVRQMVQQSGMYTRFCLLNNQRRFFALGIGLHFTTLDVYVFVYHRSGFSSSHPLKLTTEEGFMGLVRHVVGILSFKGEAAYGLDTTRTQGMFYINNRYYEIVRPLYMRSSPWGRSTVVHSLRANTNEPPLGLQLESRMLSFVQGITQIPDRLTYKQTYPIKGNSQEGPLFSEVIGQFGVVDVIGYYICGTEEPHGSTGPFLVNAQVWDVFKDQINEEVDEQDPPECVPTPSPRHHQPQERGLQCIALSTEGQALVDLRNENGGTPSPGELLETILHAIIGHYNLFKNGILHRDVSSGNVLRHLEPVQRPPLDKFECTRSVNFCRGFLIDGDHAIKWREVTGSRSIPGTMPFMSVRILEALKGRQMIIKTALDDLESFLWVLIWGVIYASKDVEGAKKANPGIQEILNAWSGDLTYNITKIITAERKWTRYTVFGGLIHEWLDIFSRANNETWELMQLLPTIPPDNQKGSDWSRACDWLESYFTKTYEDVLKSGFDHLKDVGKYSNWTDAVAANCRR